MCCVHHKCTNVREITSEEYVIIIIIINMEQMFKHALPPTQGLRCCYYVRPNSSSRSNLTKTADLLDS